MAKQKKAASKTKAVKTTKTTAKNATKVVKAAKTTAKKTPKAVKYVYVFGAGRGAGKNHGWTD